MSVKLHHKRPSGGVNYEDRYPLRYTDGFKTSKGIGVGVHGAKTNLFRSISKFSGNPSHFIALILNWSGKMAQVVTKNMVSLMMVPRHTN